MPKFHRKTYDKATKARVVDAVLSGQTSVRDIAARENIQPYQVYAWIGERSLSDALANPASSGATGTHPALPALSEVLTHPDVCRAIGEAWIRSALNGGGGANK